MNHNMSDLLQVNSVTADPSGYCYTGFSNTPLGTLNFVLEQSPLYTTEETTFTAIAATPHLEETVIFLGDHQGSLRKVSIK